MSSRSSTTIISARTDVRASKRFQAWVLHFAVPVDAQDLQPGKIPEILSDPRTLTFVMTITLHAVSRKLIVRCDRDGGIYVSIGARYC
jgi:hypothetical protein